MATDPASSPAAVAPGVPRASIRRSRASPAIAGGTNDRPTTAARRASNAPSSAAISCRNPSRSAAAVPACSATSKLLRASASSSYHGQPASHGTSEMWAELETGSSSVGPWMTPSDAARPGLSSRAAGVAGTRSPLRLGCRRCGRLPGSPSPDEPVNDAGEDRGQHDVVPVVEVVAPLLPTVADLAADETEHQHPRDAAGQSEPGEAPERHLRDARRQ